MKTILVVGGAGFIGSYVNKILQTKYNTLVLDNLSHGCRENVPNTPLIVDDFGKKSSLQEIFSKNKIDAVMHFAAFTDVGESCRNPQIYYQNNVVNTLTLLDTMKEFGVNHFIFSSSAAIFGNPTQSKINENHSTQPINPYGQTKLTVERILHDYKPYGLKSCSLRYFNAAGGDPERKLRLDVDKSSNLIPVIIRSIRQEKPVQVFGNDYPTRDGTCIRDYIHIHDLATAHYLALNYLFNGGPISAFNLGNGEGFSVKEVIDTASKVMGYPIPFVISPKRPGDPPLLLADASLARKELNWQPIYPDLATIIDHAWQASVKSVTN